MEGWFFTLSRLRHSRGSSSPPAHKRPAQHSGPVPIPGITRKYEYVKKSYAGGLPIDSAGRSTNLAFFPLASRNSVQLPLCEPWGVGGLGLIWSQATSHQSNRVDNIWKYTSYYSNKFFLYIKPYSYYRAGEFSLSRTSLEGCCPGLCGGSKKSGRSLWEDNLSPWTTE